MTIKKALLALMIILLGGLITAPSILYAQQDGTKEWSDEAIIKMGYVPYEVVVEFNPKAVDVSSLKDVEAFASTAIESVPMKTKETLQFANAAVFTVGTEGLVDSYIKELKKNPNVVSVTPNYVFTFDSRPNDPLYIQQWALNNPTNPTADIDIENAWNIGTGGTDKIIALLDTGVAYDHPDLAANMWGGGKCRDENGQAALAECKHGWDYVNNDPDPRDDNGHGTHMAGIIAANTNNRVGIAGVSQNARIMVVKIGTSYGTLVNVVKGVQFARNNKATIINASFSGPQETIDQYNLYRTAIEQFTSTGLLIASAGNDKNDNDTRAIYPAGLEFENIIAVAASDENDRFVERFSNWGANTVDVFAPGNNIWSTALQNHHQEPILPSHINTTPPWKAQTVQLSNNTNTEALFTNLGTYTTKTQADAISPSFDLSSRIDPDSVSLSLTAWCDTEPQGSKGNVPDYVQISVSTNGTQWTPLQEQTKGVDRISEESLRIPYNYSSYAGAQEAIGFRVPAQYFSSQTQFKFQWVTDENDAGGPYRGCYLYDITLNYLEDGESGQGSQAYEGGIEQSGTSQAAAFVTGITALVWNTFPQLTPEQVRYAVVNSGDPITNTHPANGGQLTATGKRVNAHKAMLLAQELSNDRLFLTNDITVRSTSAGGNWSSPTTWIGGNVPTSTDVVEINGTVMVDANATVNGMLISPGATLQGPGVGSNTLNISGSRGELQNKGNITGQGGTQLTINANIIENTGAISGLPINTQDLYHRGTITNVNDLQIQGTLRHHGSMTASTVVFNGTGTTQQLFSDANQPLGAQGNVILNNDVNVTGELILAGNTTINSGASLTMPPGSTVVMNGADLVQNGAINTAHLAFGPGVHTWSGTVSFAGQSVRLAGNITLPAATTLSADVLIESGTTVNGTELTVDGVLTNQGDLSGLSTVIANGNVINSGVARVHLRARADVEQNGDMTGGSITFEGAIRPQSMAGTQPYPYVEINSDVAINGEVECGATVTIGTTGIVTVNPGSALRLRGLDNAGQLTADHLIFEAGTGTWQGTGTANINQVTLRSSATISVVGDQTVEQLTLEPNTNLTNNNSTFYNITINGNLTNQGRIHGRLRIYLKGNLDNAAGYVNLSVFSASWDQDPSTSEYEFQLTDTAGTWQTPIAVGTNSYSIYPYITQTNLQWRYRPIINGTPGNWSTPRLIN